MSTTYFYQYDFKSPAPLYAEIKEEFDSYFASGAMDDLLFSRWTEDALRDLSRGMLPIEETVLFIEDFKSVLPVDFKAVREAWACLEGPPTIVRDPASVYKLHVTLLNPDEDICKPCDPCTPYHSKLVYKINGESYYTSPITHKLFPANMATKKFCGDGCPTSTPTVGVDGFDIRNGVFQTGFREGTIYLRYYAEKYDDDNFLMIPDNRKIENYISTYIKYKLLKKYKNEITDETFNQVASKYAEAKMEKEEAFVMADIEAKKQTVYQKRASMRKTANRHRKYNFRY